MSQDLFAAFESAGSKPINRDGGTISYGDDDLQQVWSVDEAPGWPEQHTPQPRSEELGPIPSGEPGIDNDDDFGDFEDASASAAPILAPQSSTTLQFKNQLPRARPEIIAESRTLPPKASIVEPAAKPEPKQENAGSHPFADRMDLLFEADDDDYDAGADELADLSANPEAAMAYSKRIIAEQEAAQAKKETLKPAATNFAASKPVEKKANASNAKKANTADSGPKKLRKKSGYVPAGKSEVLFDADNALENETGFDDFGDFENFEGETEPKITGARISKSAPAQKQTSMPAIDLLGLDDVSDPSQSVNGAERQTWSSQYEASPWASETTRETPAAIATAQASEQEDDGWDDFETSAPSMEPPFSDQNDVQRASSHTKQPSNSANAATSSSFPPPNVPPPSVLLSLFPNLFAAADDTLFDTMAKLDLNQRQILLAHPASHQFLKGYLGHCTVLAHIIAGRKLRWKRDQHLSQSMRIGPSAAGGKGGMKLAGVDKSEVTKEDREVLDVIRLWKAQVGKLRTAVTAASAAPALPKLPAVPDVAEQMSVKSLKPGEGGITAPHACALCGLKREERVSKVDVEVEDSFGQWWIQGTNMHVSCRRFWEEFERKLKSR